MQHHAYYIESQNPAEVSLGIATPVEVFEKFGIDDAKSLISRAQLKQVQGLNTFVLAISSITSEAQQALLKLFEEPQPGQTFIVIVPHGVLLPTVRSRMLPYTGEVKEGKSGSEAKKFLGLSYKDRSASITALLKDDEGVKEKVRALLLGLEAELFKKIKDKAAREGLEDIAKVRSYVNDRSPSLKMLLEHLAVTLPRI